MLSPLNLIYTSNSIWIITTFHLAALNPRIIAVYWIECYTSANKNEMNKNVVAVVLSFLSSSYMMKKDKKIKKT
jgi:hypothetical protein